MINEEIKKRLLSFAWRWGMFVAVSALGWLANNIGLLQLDAFWTTSIAYVINELTKWLNAKYELGGKVLGAIKK